MKSSDIYNQEYSTPALVYDTSVIHERLSLLNAAQKKSSFNLLYSIKSASFSQLLEFILPYTQGFSASSCFESRYARELLGADRIIYYTSPSLNKKELSVIDPCVQYMSFNSWQQFERMSPLLGERNSFELRINPHTRFHLDERYDPCRQFSKLGVSISSLKNKLDQNTKLLESVKGLHIHNNCGSRNFEELYETVRQITNTLDGHFDQFNSINLGGGYLFEDENELTELIKTVDYLNSNFDLEIYFEPGKAIVNDAGSMVSTVIDLFDSDGKDIAVLDTTVNHLPEIFEYQRKPKILNTQNDEQYQYRLAGCSCLSGDIFGDYYFSTPLEIGSRVVIESVGAYMFVKANMFNGINMPSVYLYDQEKGSGLIKSHTYEDYQHRLT